MISQVVIKIDRKLKRAAQIQAKASGLTLSEWYQHAAESFLAVPEIPNAKTARALKAALKDVKSNRNFSPKFDNVDEMIAHLER